MFRNSILYRRLWYMWRRNRKKAVFYLLTVVLLLCALLLPLLAFHIIEPSIRESYESTLRDAALNAAKDVSSAEFPGEIDLEKLIRVNRDQDGKLNYIRADTEALNKLLPAIESEVRKRLPQELKCEDLLQTVSFHNLGVLSASARLGFKAKNDAYVNAEFESEFTYPDAEHTYCIIYLKVRTGVLAELLLVRRHIEIKTVIPFAEVLIAG